MDLKEKIEILLRQDEFLNIEVISFNDTKETFPVKIVSFALKWTDQSTGTLRALGRERESGHIKLYGYLFRYFIFLTFSKSIGIKRALRNLYFWFSKNRHISASFTDTPPAIDLLFCTSLTNTESDLQVSIFYRKYSIPIIATVRSWDNLVTKGVLKFAPDVFLSHSVFMSNTARQNHGLTSETIQTIVTPSYQKKFLPKFDRKISNDTHIVYGCTGPFINPDEIHFIAWLCLISDECYSLITIVHHPKFLNDLQNINLGNVKVKTFDYLDTTLEDYYSFLAMQNFVIASGTTLLLDAIFLGVPVIGLEFEINRQNFWSSHLRSYDYLPHTKILFESSALNRVDNKNDLKDCIIGLKPPSYINSPEINFITGDINCDFNVHLVSNISKLLSY